MTCLGSEALGREKEASGRGNNVLGTPESQVVEETASVLETLEKVLSVLDILGKVGGSVLFLKLYYIK